jgi:hypothetical protein
MNLYEFIQEALTKILARIRAIQLLALALSIALAGCADRSADANHVVQLLLKAVGHLKKVTLVGSYLDQDTIVVVYRDEADFTGAWTRYRCYPPAGSSRWYCQNVERPDHALFLDE